MNHGCRGPSGARGYYLLPSLASSEVAEATLTACQTARVWARKRSRITFLSTLSLTLGRRGFADRYSADEVEAAVFECRAAGMIRQSRNPASRETRPQRSGPWTIELTAVPQFQVRLHDLLHSQPASSRSQRRPRAARPSDPSIHPQDRKPANVPRGQSSGPTASPSWVSCPRILSPDPRTAGLANRTPSLLRSSPRPSDHEPRWRVGSDDTEID